MKIACGGAEEAGRRVAREMRFGAMVSFSLSMTSQ